MDDQRTCNQPGCTAPTGVCLDGFAKYSEECPHWLASPESVEVSTPESSESNGDESDHLATHSDVVKTSAGSTLDYVDCDRILRQKGGRVVSVVSGPRAGKTSLIVALYELLTRGRLDDCLFAGSETLRGFEERCHLTRVASGLDVPDMPRTRVRSTATILHLAASKDSRVTQYFFLDRSGESFDALLATPALAQGYSDLDRADDIWFILDGAILLNNPARALSGVRRMFQAVLQAGFLNRKRVVLIVTKADLLTPEENANATLKIASDFADELSGRLKGQEITVVKTSAHTLQGSAENIASMRSLFSDFKIDHQPQYRTWRKDSARATGMELLQKVYEELP